MHGKGNDLGGGQGPPVNAESEGLDRHLELARLIDEAPLHYAEEFALQALAASARAVEERGEPEAAAAIERMIRARLADVPPIPQKPRPEPIPAPLELPLTKPGEPLRPDVQARLEQACIRILERRNPGTKWVAS